MHVTNELVVKCPSIFKPLISQYLFIQSNTQSSLLWYNCFHTFIAYFDLFILISWTKSTYPKSKKCICLNLEPVQFFQFWWCNKKDLWVSENTTQKIINYKYVPFQTSKYVNDKNWERILFNLALYKYML